MDEQQKIRAEALALALSKKEPRLKLMYVAEVFEKFIRNGIDHSSSQKYEL